MFISTFRSVHSNLLGILLIMLGKKGKETIFLPSDTQKHILYQFCCYIALLLQEFAMVLPYNIGQLIQLPICLNSFSTFSFQAISLGIP